jgi:endogenous inhibitor of DNA gyrase (YacG/DUF329 family)
MSEDRQHVTFPVPRKPPRGPFRPAYRECPGCGITLLMWRSRKSREFGQGHSVRTVQLEVARVPCPICGTEFLKTRPIQVYCSKNCRCKAWYRAHKVLVAVKRKRWR